MKISKHQINIIANALLSIYLDNFLLQKGAMSFSYIAFCVAGNVPTGDSVQDKLLMQRHIDNYNKLIFVFPKKSRNSIYKKCVGKVNIWLSEIASNDQLRGISSKNLSRMTAYYQDIHNLQIADEIQLLLRAVTTHSTSIEILEAQNENNLGDGKGVVARRIVYDIFAETLTFLPNH
jgi:hypothetical protein